MIIDKTLELSAKQSLASGAAVSTNVIDFGAAGRDFNTDFGLGKLAVVITVNEAVTGDVIIKVEESADNSSFTALFTSGVLQSPAAGTKFIVPLPIKDMKQYLRTNYVADTTTGATAISAGKVSAAVVWGFDQWVAPAGAPL